MTVEPPFNWQAICKKGVGILPRSPLIALYIVLIVSREL